MFGREKRDCPPYRLVVGGCSSRLLWFCPGVEGAQQNMHNAVIQTMVLSVYDYEDFSVSLHSCTGQYNSPACRNMIYPKYVQ